MCVRFVLSAGLFALVAGAATAKESAKPAADLPRPPEKIYAVTCGYCHGVNVGPKIRGRKLDPEMTAYVVRNGKSAMPAFRPTEITDAELKALAKWLKASKADPKEHGQ
jgi:mono/diheme cytochrome c family protein